MVSSTPVMPIALVRPTDDQARILAAGQRRMHLADALLDREELRVVAAERVGSSVSSMVIADTPAVSSSSTVRLTFIALP